MILNPFITTTLVSLMLATSAMAQSPVVTTQAKKDGGTNSVIETKPATPNLLGGTNSGGSGSGILEIDWCGSAETILEEAWNSSQMSKRKGDLRQAAIDLEIGMKQAMESDAMSYFKNSQTFRAIQLGYTTSRAIRQKLLCQNPRLENLIAELGGCKPVANPETMHLYFLESYYNFVLKDPNLAEVDKSVLTPWRLATANVCQNCTPQQGLIEKHESKFLTFIGAVLSWVNRPDLFITRNANDPQWRPHFDERLYTLVGEKVTESVQKEMTDSPYNNVMGVKCAKTKVINLNKRFKAFNEKTSVPDSEVADILGDLVELTSQAIEALGAKTSCRSDRR